MNVASLRRFRAALIGPTQLTPQVASAVPLRKPESSENAVFVVDVLIHPFCFLGSLRVYASYLSILSGIYFFVLF